MIEIVEIPTDEIVEVSATGDTIEIHDDGLQLVETAEQGPPGPSGVDDYDQDIVLIYQIAKL